MALVRQGHGASTAVWLAFLVATAMIVVFSSCAAADYCQFIGPCNTDACYALCLQKNYTGNFQAYCLPSFTASNSESCCCRVPGSRFTAGRPASRS